MIKESNFNKRLRDEMGKLGFKTIRVESHSTAPGAADNHMIHHSGWCGWVEIKQVESLPSRVKYRPQQALWHENVWKAGGNSATLVHLKYSDEMILVPGHRSREAEKCLTAIMCEPVNVFRCDHSGWLQLAATLLGLDSVRHREQLARGTESESDYYKEP